MTCHHAFPSRSSLPDQLSPSSTMISPVCRRLCAMPTSLRPGASVNPQSVFLRFPDRPNARIIGLPSHLSAPWEVSGIKWIASYPDNIRAGLPRASAVLIINSHEHGYPLACLEASIISAARTAASAVLAARYLSANPYHVVPRHRRTGSLLDKYPLPGHGLRIETFICTVHRRRRTDCNSGLRAGST